MTQVTAAASGPVGGFPALPVPLQGEAELLVLPEDQAVLMGITSAATVAGV